MPQALTGAGTACAAQEVRCLSRCGRAGVCIPCIYLVDVAAHRIVMEKIQGRALKDFLRDSYDAQQGTYSPLSLQVVVSTRQTPGRAAREGGMEAGGGGPHTGSGLVGCVLVCLWHGSGAAGQGGGEHPRRRDGARGPDHLQLHGARRRQRTRRGSRAGKRRERRDRQAGRQAGTKSCSRRHERC